MHTEISEITGDSIIDIAIDTLKKSKQMIVFVNTKRSAEATAEKIASKIIKIDEIEKKISATLDLTNLSNSIQTVLSSPTKQCKRLGAITKRGVAFHHAGLNSKQRELIEDSYRAGLISIICATPTLAAGVDLPAYRVIIRDLKRYGGQFGMTKIPVLEYSQMSGRAGRPKYDKIGEAICIAGNVEEKERIWNEYVNGEPEEILSKLAVEPVLRTYILSLIATGYVNSVSSLNEFMSKTFYAHQYQELSRLFGIIQKMISKLEEWEFISVSSGNKQDDFVSASELVDLEDSGLKATKLGERVAELYLDPLTAHHILICMQKAASKKYDDFSIIQMISSTLEMRPLLKARQKDYEAIEEKIVLEEGYFIAFTPDEFSEDYEEFLDSVKTSIVFEDWMNEITEDKLLENYNITPGELNAKLDRADWLVYASYELCKLQNFKELKKDLLKLRIRLKNGVKAELLPLLKLKNVGRVRARKMFANGIKDLGDVKKKDLSSLASLLGKKIALDVKKQVGQDLSHEKIVIKPNKRKGQISLADF